MSGQHDLCNEALHAQAARIAELEAEVERLRTERGMYANAAAHLRAELQFAGNLASANVNEAERVVAEVARLRSVMDVMGEALRKIDDETIDSWAVGIARAALTKYREASEPLRATSEEMSRGPDHA